MKAFKNTVVPILIAGIWVSISEFVRNELIAKSYWIEHYNKMKLIFPSEPVNGIVWGIWGFLLAIVIFILSKKYALLQTLLLSWLTSFLMMWLVIGNLGVLPFGILWIAVPLSVVEVSIAALVIYKLPSKMNNRP